MSEADDIRQKAFELFVKPARAYGLTAVSIAASDLHKAMDLQGRFPNVCQALGGRKFRETFNLELLHATSPNPSSTTIFSYRLL